MSFHFLAALAFAASASYYDLKQRIVPDKLNYGFLLLALSLNYSRYGAAARLLDAVVLTAAAFVFAYLLYKAGAWAGGDAKYFTALSAFIPLFHPGFTFYSFLYVFFLSVALLVPVLITVYWRQLLKLEKELNETLLYSFKAAFEASLFSFLVIYSLQLVSVSDYSLPLAAGIVLVSLLARLPFVVTGPAAAIIALLNRNELTEVLALLAMLFAVSLALVAGKRVFGLISQKVLRRKVKASKLMEGMIPAESVFLLGKGAAEKWTPKGFLDVAKRLQEKRKSVVSCLRARGVSNEEIKELKRAGVKELWVRESIPFTPVLSAGFLAAVLWGLHAF